jgi:AmmeMemoRadiSam system protein A
MFQLLEHEQEFLLRIARDAVASHLTGAEPACESGPGRLAEPHGVFVSIHNGPELRGCVGNIQPFAPLYQSTRECAVCAAVADPRFAPLTKLELPQVTFEISVLAPMERIENVDEIVVGDHGLHIRKGNARGLLLPQVASVNGWDRYRFLAETCRKAGLGRDDWKEGSIIHRFQALVFGEDHLNLSPAS